MVSSAPRIVYITPAITSPSIQTKSLLPPRSILGICWLHSLRTVPALLPWSDHAVTMAKLLSFVAILLVASAILAEAHTAPPPSPTVTKTPPPPPAPAPSHGVIRKPPTFSLKCIIHNVATRDVTFKLVIRGKAAGRTVVAKAGKWTAIGPVKVGCKVPVVHVCVTVKTYKGVVVKKTFPVQLKLVLKHIVPKSSKVLVLTASEVKSWRGKKFLVVKVGRKVKLTVKL